VSQLEMSMPEARPELPFTAEQREAIERRDGPLFLQAGAGSGKTRVLAERFVRAVCDDGVAVDAILAITFTEKAAAELKERIRRRFVELGEREHAREAEAAWISTIHGFCSRVLRTHALAAGLDPEYRVLDEVEAERIAVDAFDRALQDFLGRDAPDRVDLAAAYGADRLARMVRTVHARLRSRGERRPRLPEIEPPVPRGERERLAAAVRAAARELGGADATRKAIADALRQLERCGNALEDLPEGEPGDPARFEELAVRRGNTAALRTPAFEELAEAEKGWVIACKAQREYLDYTLLRELLELYDARHEELKEAASALDFEDLELRARDLLRESEPLREHYLERFAHVMVDEYQDTNELQNSLLELVSRDNLFTVGDELQSIYLFRNADVNVFRGRRDKAAERGAVRRLTGNFRSRRELLDVLNPAFASVWGQGFQPLRAQEPERAPRLSPSVDLLVVDDKRGRWDELAESRGEGDELFGFTMRRTTPWRVAEARLLAKRVDELTRGGPFEPGDVAVLLRAATDMAVYERALAERGLPTYAVGGRGYWGQQQTADLRAYLAVLANPHDELALYNLLATPLVGASLDAVVLVGLCARRLKRDPWWALEQAFLEGGDGSDGLADALPAIDRERLAAFVHRLVAERAVAGRLSLETLIDRAVTGSGYDRAVLAMPSGARRMANVRKLMRLAREYEARSGRDLRGFIDLLDQQDLMQAREGEAPLEVEGMEAVRIMTIHAAKGLEFPVVCVADLGRHARGDDLGLQVTTDGRVGLRLASLTGAAGNSKALERIREEQEREHEAEERRILYVAMTRAQEHLVVSGATDLEKWPEAKPLDAPMTWVWRALASGLPDAAAGGPEALIAHRHEGRSAEVRCLVCSPATLDALLGPDDRKPSPDRARPAEELAVEPPPLAPLETRPALPVSRLSYSALESYGRCGYRFYLERVLQLRDWSVPELPATAAPVAEEAAEDGGEGPAEAGIAAGAEPPPAALPLLLRGSVVHQLLEGMDLSRGEVPGDDEIAARIEQAGAAPTEADVADVRSLLTGFAGSELRRRLGAARRLRRELPFAFTLDVDGRELLVTGVLDVHAAEERGMLVVDYKSDHLAERTPDQVVEEDYATQRVVYALAALRAGAERAEVAYCFLERPDEPAVAVFAPDDAPALERRLLELAAGVLEARFEPSDRPHRGLCQFCPGQPALCSWEPERTFAELP
jgi:ATP-dependent helicase/nuclease subunit A